MKRIWIYNATVVRIIDGDTIVVDLDMGLHIWRRDEENRLYGINTPEVRGEEKVLGKLAKAFVEALLPVGLAISIESKELDKYGRILGDVSFKNGDIWCDSLSMLLIDSGYAVEWFGEGTRPKFNINEQYPKG